MIIYDILDKDIDKYLVRMLYNMYTYKELYYSISTLNQCKDEIV